MAITASQVKELRERTGIGMMECKKALTECGGDIDAAIEFLRKNSALKAEKKQSRVASDGVISAKTSDDGKTSILLEVNCESDFVALDDNFLSFVDEMTDFALKTNSADVDSLMNEDNIKKCNQLVQKIGEKIDVRRLSNVAGDVCSFYIHSNKKLGAIVAVKGGNEDVAKDVAMHVAACSPVAISKKDISEAVIEKEKSIFRAQMEDSGKPADIIDKIINGKIAKFLSQVTLENQDFVKDNTMTVKQFCDKHNASILSFVRFEVGEGIEKKVVDFADEVKAMTSGK